MQNATRVIILPLVDETRDEEIIDILSAISMVSGRLATLLKYRKEGDKNE